MEPNGRPDGFSISKDRSELYMAESEADVDEIKELKKENQHETETSRLLELANTIQAQVTQIQKYLTETKQPSPKFEATTPLTDWQGVDNVRGDCLENLTELMDLLMTPREVLHTQAPTNMASRHAIDRVKLHRLVPLEGSTTYSSLAWATMLPVKTLRRLLRHAMAQRIFYEPEPGRVAHTHASRLLAENANVRDYFGTVCQEVWPAAARLVDAVETWPGGTGREETGYQLAHGRTIYQTLAAEPGKQVRYDSAMGAFNNDRIYSHEHTIRGFDWETLGEGAVVVDVGGGVGNASRALARAFPGLRFVVQDQEAVIRNAAIEDPDIKDRIEFMVHDMFTPQPVKGAAVYFFRRVMMEWTDEQATTIIRNLKPALKKGALVQIQDPHLGAPGSFPVWAERRYRDSDLLALAVANAGSREEEEWEQVFKLAGPGFEFKGVRTMRESNIAFIEAVWVGGDPPEGNVEVAGSDQVVETQPEEVSIAEPELELTSSEVVVPAEPELEPVTSEVVIPDIRINGV